MVSTPDTQELSLDDGMIMDYVVFEFYMMPLMGRGLGGWVD